MNAKESDCQLCDAGPKCADVVDGILCISEHRSRQGNACEEIHVYRNRYWPGCGMYGIFSGDVLFSMVGYFNGNNKTVWVMTQGLIQTLLVRLPFAYVMSIQPNASLTKIGLAAPVSTMIPGRSGERPAITHCA